MLSPGGRDGGGRVSSSLRGYLGPCCRQADPWASRSAAWQVPGAGASAEISE